MIEEAIVLGDRAAAGARHRHRGRLPHDGRGPRRARPEALQAAVPPSRCAPRRNRACGRCSRCSRARRRSSISTSTAVKAQRLGINVADVFGALQADLGSFYVNDFNLLGRTFRVDRAGARASHRLDTEGRAADPRAQSLRATPCRSARSPPRERTTGPYRVPRYNLYPAAELDGSSAPGFSHGPGIDDDAEDRARNAARRLQLRMDDARVPADPVRATPRASPSCSAWCSCFSCSPRNTRA